LWKSALLGDGPAGDAQGGDERDSIGVVPGVLGGIEHQRADRVVATQVSPDLLDHQARGLGAQHCARPTLVGLQLIEAGLDLPALGVGAGQFSGGRLAVVEQGGDQPVWAGGIATVLDRVADHSDPDRVFTALVGDRVEDVGH